MHLAWSATCEIYTARNSILCRSDASRGSLGASRSALQLMTTGDGSGRFAQ